MTITILTALDLGRTDHLDLDLIFLLFLFSLLILFFLRLALILKRLTSANGAF